MLSDRPRVASQTREVERAIKDPPCTTVVCLGVCQGSSHMGDSAQKIQSLCVCTCMYTRVRAWFERVWLLGGIVDSGFMFRGIKILLVPKSTHLPLTTQIILPLETNLLENQDLNTAQHAC